MPWKSGKEFAAAHNKKLTGHSASGAAKMANAILRKGGSEKIAIATANKYGDRLMSKKGK